MHNIKHYFNKTSSLHQCLVILSASLLTCNKPVLAEIVPDTSLTTPSKINQVDNITVIKGGIKKGQNLFHSFQRFSIRKGQKANFDSNGFKNIFARVTGNDISLIDGVLSTAPSSNLIFINPNGIHFGRNASLSIGRSFFATTASSISFPDNRFFFASKDRLTIDLSSASPLGIQLTSSEAKITVDGDGHSLSSGFLAPINIGNSLSALTLNPKQTFAIIGGEIAIIGGTLSAPGGSVRLIGLDSGNVDLQVESESLNIAAVNPSIFDRILITNKSLINTSSQLPQFNGGSVGIDASDLSLLNGSAIIIQNLGATNAGDINLRISNEIQIDGSTPDGSIPSTIINQTLPFAEGDGGNINITTSRLLLNDGGQIFASSFGNGNSGNIIVDVSKDLIVNGFIPDNPRFVSNIGSGSFSNSNAGRIDVNAQQLEITNGGFITNVSGNPFSNGNGGDLTIQAEDILLSGSSPLTPSSLGVSVVSSGNGGELLVETNTLTIAQGARLDASNFLNGSAGNITVNASERVLIDGRESSSPFTSQIIASANNLPPDLKELFGVTDDVPTGSSGNILLNTPILSLNSFASVNVKHDGIGDAGSLKINADVLALSEDSILSAETLTGDGGNISISLQKLLLSLQNSSISTKSIQNGSGGNISISTSGNLSLIASPNENNDIVAGAFDGPGGDIDINSSLIIGYTERTRTNLQSQGFLTPESLDSNDISAISQQGDATLDGMINLDVLESDPNKILSRLPENITNISSLITQVCQADNNNNSNLIIHHRSAHTTLSDDTQLSKGLSSGWIQRPSMEISSSITRNRKHHLMDSPSTNQVIEAQYWIHKPSGVVELMRHDENNAHLRLANKRLLSSC